MGVMIVMNFAFAAIIILASIKLIKSALYFHKNFDVKNATVEELKKELTSDYGFIKVLLVAIPIYGPTSSIKR